MGNTDVASVSDPKIIPKVKVKVLMIWFFGGTCGMGGQPQRVVLIIPALISIELNLNGN